MLWRSEIFGGISNEISVLLDQSTLPKDMKGIPFTIRSHFCVFHILFLVDKGYLKRLEQDPQAAICLGDSAYHRSKVKEELGIKRPVPHQNDGAQQTVSWLIFCKSYTHSIWSQGAEVKSSHSVQSVRAVVEQTIADIKQFKVMGSNKIRTVEKFEKILDVVMALHNLLILFKLRPDFDLPARRAAIPREHVFQPLIPKKDVDLKIPLKEPDFALPKYRHIQGFKHFLPSAAKALKDALERGGKGCKFFPTVLERGKNLYKGAYVLQFRVMRENSNVWTVKYVVRASYSIELHTGYFTLSQDEAGINHICDCFSG